MRLAFTKTAATAAEAVFLVYKPQGWPMGL